MRSQQEILNRIKEVEWKDFYGFERNDLRCALTFENALPFIKPGTTKKQWDAIVDDNTPERVREKIVEYIPLVLDLVKKDQFAAHVLKSMAHFRAWCWLINDYRIVEIAERADYYPSGIPRIMVLHEHFIANKPDVC